MPQQFLISLKALIQNNEGKVLFLVKERGGKKFLDLPGGRMEGNDSFEQTLKREIVEELSATQELNIIKQVGEVWELPQEFMKDGNRQLIISFLAKITTGDISLSEEHTEHIWIDGSDLADIGGKNFVLLDGYRNNLKILFS